MTGTVRVNQSFVLDIMDCLCVHVCSLYCVCAQIYTISNVICEQYQVTCTLYLYFEQFISYEEANSTVHS